MPVRRRDSWFSTSKASRCIGVRKILRPCPKPPESEEWVHPSHVSVDIFLWHCFAVKSSPSYDIIEQKKKRNPLLTSTRAMITSPPDWNRRCRRIACALSLWSCRAAGSRAFLARGYRKGWLCRPSQITRRFYLDYALMQRQPENPKGMHVLLTGI